MMNVFPHQVAQACRSAFVPITTKIPGQLWYGKVDPDAASPYATLSVTQESRMLDSLGVIQTFRVQISICSDSGVFESGELIKAIADCWDEQPERFVILGSGIIRIRLTEPDEEIEDQRRNASDVVSGRVAFRLTTDTRE
ncbi:hypothetical protein KIH39_00045 [Telmatocola sphagniphila]|uniref:Uncharacterized protein n=1 Tax=Telmatocola sphagniphila TaxID=1123043 RepID=A0A8E6B8H1_9BACT|nr:hypothetical protein [Telmatocola sphagniphila]QVL32345.1 hypothetical protein KIH39_00045 [Telmatocola sphagniphila]